MLISLAWASDKTSLIDMPEASSNLKAHWLAKDDVISLLIGSQGAGMEGGDGAERSAREWWRRRRGGMERESNWEGRCRPAFGWWFLRTVLRALPIRLGIFRRRENRCHVSGSLGVASDTRESHARLQAWGASSANASVTVSVFLRCLKCCRVSTERWRLNQCRSRVSPRCRGDLGRF